MSYALTTEQEAEITALKTDIATLTSEIETMQATYNALLAEWEWVKQYSKMTQRVWSTQVDSTLPKEEQISDWDRELANRERFLAFFTDNNIDMYHLVDLLTASNNHDLRVYVFDAIHAKYFADTKTTLDDKRAAIKTKSARIDAIWHAVVWG